MLLAHITSTTTISRAHPGRAYRRARRARLGLGRALVGCRHTRQGAPCTTRLETPSIPTGAMMLTSARPCQCNQGEPARYTSRRHGGGVRSGSADQCFYPKMNRNTEEVTEIRPRDCLTRTVRLGYYI
jgi:hypothetical protein